MLLWEMLHKPAQPVSEHQGSQDPVHRVSQRLPYETRCGAIAKTGLRCRGKIRTGSDVCLFHDPEFMEKLRLRNASGRVNRRRALTHLPDGYLRKLTNRTAIGHAMDRLYREVRLGVITPQMGTVMFNILTRLLDSGLEGIPKPSGRARADRLRPKVASLLTRGERKAWREVVATAGDVVGDPRPMRATPEPTTRTAQPASGNGHGMDRAIKIAFPAAS